MSLNSNTLAGQPDRAWLRRFASLGYALALAPVIAPSAGCIDPLCRSTEFPDAGEALGDKVIIGSTAGAQDVFQASCGALGAPDRAFTWSAPSSGRYRFDTAGSSLDTVLYVQAGDACEGEVIACDDDGGPVFSSLVEVDLEAGETVYVVVEGFSGGGGEFVVNIRHMVEQECSDGLDDDDDDLVDCADPDCGCECPDGMLGATLDEPVTGSTLGGNDFSASSCGGGSAPDASFAWTPPDTGRYRIDTEGSSFDTVLYVQEGEMCGGAELGCNDDGGALGGVSALEIVLEGGAPVIITVDGYGEAAGEYVLNIAPVRELDCTDGADGDDDGAVDCEDDDCDCDCPSEDLGSALGEAVYQGSTAGHGNLGAGSCGGASEAEASFTWTAPATGAYRIDTSGSDFDTVLYAQEGDVCGGAELACDDNAVFGGLSEISLALAAGETVVLTVDGARGESGDFVLNIVEVHELSCVDGDDEDGDGAIDCEDDDCDCTCPMDDLGAALGAPVLEGSTSLRGNLDAGSCGGGSAPDASLVWTAPVGGDYRIHTAGSEFDTVLYVREGDVCGGAELACNDDTAGPQSQLELGFAAGESVVITVDGFGVARGAFALSIECLTCN